jgi:hypothetical protein
MDVILGEILEVVQGSEMEKNAWKGLQAALRSFAANGLIVKLASRLRKVSLSWSPCEPSLIVELPGRTSENRCDLHQYMSSIGRFSGLA